MGKIQSRVTDNSQSHHHFTLSEISRLSRAFKNFADSDNTIDKSDFKLALTNHVSAWSGGAQYMFLERLFDAFDLDGNHRIDFDEFIKGLSIFFKGTEEEKAELSFRLYDLDRDGTIHPDEFIKILSAMYSDFYKSDHTQKIRETVHQIMQDFDVNGDGTLSIIEFKLMALKEPMIVDFVEEFLYVPDKSADRNRRVSLLEM